MKNKKKFLKTLLLGGIIKSTTAVASTSGKGLVWEENTNDLSKSISGPVALGVGTIAIVITALTWAMSDGHGAGMSRGLKIVIALGVAFGATGIITAFYKFTSSAVFI